jgi:DNA-binding response OmpR family regulator
MLESARAYSKPLTHWDLLLEKQSTERHETLLRSIWGPLYGNEREYLRVVVNQLRKKIEDDPAQPAYILTESRIGYRFRQD